MAKKAAKPKEISLEDALWNCRVALRGVGSMEKNRDAVISLVFLKFAGDKFEKRRAELVEQYGEIPAFLEKLPSTTPPTSSTWTRSRVGHISYSMLPTTTSL